MSATEVCCDQAHTYPLFDNWCKCVWYSKIWCKVSEVQTSLVIIILIITAIHLHCVWQLLRCSFWSNLTHEDSVVTMMLKSVTYNCSDKTGKSIILHKWQHNLIHEYKANSTHYSAESFSWYSRDRWKHSWTPPSFHNLFITAARSELIGTSSAPLTTAKNCRASFCTQQTHCYQHTNSVNETELPSMIKLFLINCMWRQRKTAWFAHHCALTTVTPLLPLLIVFTAISGYVLQN